MLNPASERLHLVEEVTGINAPLGLSSGNISVGLALTVIKDVMKQIRYKQGGTATYRPCM
mgnify:FL=1